MAKLPQDLIAPRALELQNIELGQIVYIRPSAVRVAPDLEVYLLPFAECESEKNILHNIRVQRDQDGFHITLLRYKTTWKPDSEPKPAWFPVASVSVELDDELNRY